PGGPRCSARPRTVSSYWKGSLRTRSRSPTRSCFARFARAPFTSTLPPSMAAAATARVLKKRAAQSQVSRRTEETSDIRGQTSDIRHQTSDIRRQFSNEAPKHALYLHHRIIEPSMSGAVQVVEIGGKLQVLLEL